MAIVLRELSCESCEAVGEICHGCGRCESHCPCDPSSRDFDSEWALITELKLKLNRRTDQIIATLNYRADKALAEFLNQIEKDAA